MATMMEYKGYKGHVEFDDEAGIFHGEVVNIRDVITFQGKSVPELQEALKVSVDEYLAFCAERGEEPEQPLTGPVVVEISPQVWAQVSAVAKLAGMSPDRWVEDVISSTSSSMIPFGLPHLRFGSMKTEDRERDQKTRREPASQAQQGD